ncbi:glycosyltransferase [Anabaena sp. FACHB-1237]|uniref:glycosyltransferase n=1 Tax=Anabaena sp. FACHB-1237 TaxID=2692769 RepID=UPI0016818853|nr:glycosyltransferase [Anabaena sp. FACHB-1237]MBD2138460.1 glycosyltransferase [Anabaena sp. FACHB-1237]
MNTRPIAFFLPTLHGGGAERVVINLLKGMSSYNIPLDLIVATTDGPYLNQVPSQVRVINLATGRVIKAILPLSKYLQNNKPIAIISHMNHANIVAVLAKKIGGTETKLILVEHNTLSFSKSNSIRAKFLPPLMKLLYPVADVIVGVSKGVAEDLESQLALEKGKVNVIYNPVIDDELIAKAKTPLEHPWFEKGCPPVFLAVGRLTAQKDFLTLIKAFGLLRKQKLARLIILGEGEQRTELEAMIRKLGISENVSMPGFVDNPYAYMSRGSAFVLSSRWEGLPTVLIEAMACGCPVIATDCPSGPREILEAGKYGTLVPVGNEIAISAAMLDILDSSVNVDVLVRKTMDFSVEQANSKYLSLLGYSIPM